MPKPAQQQNRWQACGEVLLFCIWLTISEVIKRGLCPPVRQLGLHSISRLFILAQSQGYIIFPLCTFDRWRGVGRGISRGRSVISFLFTLEGLLRVLKVMNQSKYNVSEAEVEGATAFAKAPRSWAVKQNPCMTSAWGRVGSTVCHCSVLHTDRLLVNDI